MKSRTFGCFASFSSSNVLRISRTGFEDSTYLGPGKQAPGNGAMVAQAVELTERLGAEVATAGEARKQLGLPN